MPTKIFQCVWKEWLKFLLVFFFLMLRFLKRTFNCIKPMTHHVEKSIQVSAEHIHIQTHSPNSCTTCLDLFNTFLWLAIFFLTELFIQTSGFITWGLYLIIITKWDNSKWLKVILRCSVVFRIIILFRLGGSMLQFWGLISAFKSFRGCDLCTYEIGLFPKAVCHCLGQHYM